jgi:hypothetical protein
MLAQSRNRRSPERAAPAVLVATVVVLFAAIGCGQPSQAGRGPGVVVQSAVPVALAEYFAIRRMSGASFSFDESLLAYASDEGGRMDI